MSADPATVDDRPLTVFPYPYSDRIHNAATFSSPVSRFIIQMLTAEAVRTMIPMITARAGRNYQPSADFASERLIARMCFIVSFLKCLFLVLPVHGELSSSKVYFLPFWEACRICVKPPGYATISIDLLLFLKKQFSSLKFRVLLFLSYIVSKISSEEPSSRPL